MGDKRFKEVIESHPVFANLGKGSSTENSFSRPDELIHVEDGDLYMWCNQDSCFYVTNLRLSLENESHSIQILACSPAPLFEVRRIAFNGNGNSVALIGSRGVSIMTLPQRWKRSTQENDKIFCKCVPVAERFFTTCIMVQLVQASWHPGSPAYTHICILLSDNTLRIYDFVKDSQTPVQVHKLGQYNTSMDASRLSLVSSVFSVRSAIGETMISFSFAQPVEVQEKRKKILEARKPSGNPASTILLYPVYLLQGDGDVLLMLTSVTDNRYRKGLICGPLRMQPPAEDNYGVDACSILVLKTTPMVVIIATTTGRIHHCVALTTDDYDSDDDATETQSTVSWPASVLSVQSGALQSGKFSSPTLYVYETMEIDLELLKADTEENDYGNHMISLYSDPLLLCRYHCCTKVGVHTVLLPWLDKMQTFFEEDEENKDSLFDIAQDQPCVVEHILCTKPTPSSVACAVKGFTFATNPLFGPSALCLTSDNHCTAVPLLTTFKAAAPTMLPSDVTEQETVLNLSADQSSRALEMDFQDHIQSLLRRDSSQPVLRYEPAAKDTLVDSESSQLISQVTQVLRKEYILKLKLAKDAIEKRMQLLVQQKQQQAEDIEKLRSKQHTLKENAEQLAERYEDCLEKQEELASRVELVLKHAKSKEPVLSKAEVDMAKELRTMKEKSKHLEHKIKQIKTKFEYQSNYEREEEKENQPNRRASSAGKPLRVQMFKEMLLEEGQKIEELTKKLMKLKTVVDA